MWRATRCSTTRKSACCRWADFDAIVQPWLDRHTVREIFERAGRLGMGFGAVPDVAAQLADEHSRGARLLGGGAGRDAFQRRGSADVGHAATVRRGARSRGGTERRCSAPRPSSGRGPDAVLRGADGRRADPGLGRAAGDADSLRPRRERDPRRARLLAGRPLYEPHPVPAAQRLSGEVWNRNIYFTVRNAGTRSALIDLGSDEGRALLLRLVGEADALVKNFTPGVVGRLGLDFEEPHRRFPRLVMLSISGVGQSGPNAYRPANGMTMEAASGVPTVTGYPARGRPRRARRGSTPTPACTARPLSSPRSSTATAPARARSSTSRCRRRRCPCSSRSSPDYQRNGRRQPRAGNRRPGMVRGASACRGDDD